jgi:type II restriction/modification system DNA methylase subunit YeeA
VKYYRCDLCGTRIEASELRYVLKMNIFAAYDKLQIELSDLEKDYQNEIRKLIEEMEQMDPKQLEEDVFKQFNFDLCRRCQQEIIKNPLESRRGGGEPAAELPPFDVDDFLRQLGSG